jgi:spore maturation protein CgeB
MRLPTHPRIMYVADPEYGSRRYPYVFSGIPDALNRMGLDISCLDPATATLDSFRRQVAAFKPELLVGFVQDRRQVVKMAGLLKEYHPVAAVNWFQEEPNGVASARDELDILEASASFDLWFGIDAKMLPFWRTKTAFLPPAFDDAVYYDMGRERDYAVSYIGKLGPQKTTRMYWPYMKAMARYGKSAMLCINRPMGLPLLPECFERVLRSRRRRRLLQSLPFWRCGWENPKDEMEKSLVINRSRIHVGLNRVRGDWEDELRTLLPEYPLDAHGLFYQLKGRLFQAVGAGAMALNEYCPELDELFEIDKEIVTFEFGDSAEFTEKLAWYLSHPKQREEIARAGYARARRDHTYSARIRQMLDHVRKEL